MTGSYLGRYTTTVDEMIDENVHPQTFGDHQDLRDLTLDHVNGLRLSVATEGRVAFSLSHYDECQWCDPSDQLWRDATHWYDLTRSETVFAHFDAFQRGLGNNSCGGDCCLDPYVPSADSSPIRCASRPPCVSSAQLFFIGRAFCFGRSLSHPPPFQCLVGGGCHVLERLYVSTEIVNVTM